MNSGAAQPPKSIAIARRSFLRWFALPLLAPGVGCSQSIMQSTPIIDFGKHHGSTREIIYPNPMQLNDMDPEFLWTQIIDTVDDYFDIKTETRVRRDMDQWSDGYVETFPQNGATILEPWRKDAPKGMERWQSTFQSIRRTAYLKIIPQTNGFNIGIEVVKELEDVDRSQNSGEGSASIRHDGAVVRTDQQLLSLPLTIGWIRQENDRQLEQRILKEIAGRVTNVEPPRRKLLHQ